MRIHNKKKSETKDIAKHLSRSYTGKNALHVRDTSNIVLFCLLHLEQLAVTGIYLFRLDLSKRNLDLSKVNQKIFK